MMNQVDVWKQRPTEDVLQTKLVPPQIRPDLVSRTHLLERLTEYALHSTLTLVSATAGFGKTTLLSAWATTARASISVAWLSLDEGDTLSTRFWTYVITTLETLVPACGEEALELLRLPQPPAIERILVALLNALATIRHPVVLILDDYHVISSSAVHTECAFLLDHLPAHVHLIVAAREAPPIPLHRLRASGQLAELGSAELRFSSAEVATFLRQTMHLDLDPGDIASLEERTEGWIAGLQLAALSIRELSDAAHLIASFSGSHRYILDYLAQEILNQQSREMQDFLLSTSVLDQFTAPLCDALTGRDDGYALLAQLEQANLFLVRLDNERHWYRYHRLFAEFLRERLRLTCPDLLPTLHYRASAWYADNARPFQAIAHALQGCLFAQAADLIERTAFTLWSWSNNEALAQYIEVLPRDILRSRPQLCIYYAWSLYLASKTTEAESWLCEAERQLNAQTTSDSAICALGEVFAIRALSAIKQNAMLSTLDCYQQAQALLPGTSTLHGPLKFTAAYALSSLGDDDAACLRLEEGIAMSKATGNDLYTARCYIFLACLQMSCGHMRRARTTCYQALNYGLASPTGQMLLTGAAYFSLYELHYEWNNLEDAQHYMDKTLEHARRAGDASLESTVLKILPNLLFALGQREQACALFEQEYPAVQVTSHDRVSLATLEARVRIWIQTGNIAAAARWAREYLPLVEDERNPLYATERMILAHVSLALGKPAEALRLLERPLAVSKQTGQMYTVLSGMALQALALHAQHATDGALHVLSEALALSEPEGLMRVFIDCGQPMAELLLLLHQSQRGNIHTSERGCSHDYLLKLLAAFHLHIATVPVRPPSPPVSTREREVLRLIADGLSTKEIAGHLVISEGTVKTHMKRIYAKLEVKSRTQAVARARVQQLL